MRRTVVALTHCLALLTAACGKTTTEVPGASGRAGSGPVGSDTPVGGDGGTEPATDAGVSAPSADCSHVDIPDPELARAVRDRLSLSANDEITPERLLQLNYLNAGRIGETPIVSIEGLQCAKNLTSLTVTYGVVSDLSPLERLDRLRDLNLAHNRIEDLSPLRGLPLERLFVDDNPLDDLAPLANSKSLKAFGAGLSNVSSLAALSGMPLLEQVWAEQAQLTQLSDFAPPPALEELWVGGNRIADLAPLRAFPNLIRVDVSENELQSLEPLAALPLLEYLNASNNPLITLHGLETSLVLKGLDASHCKLSDISALSSIHALIDLTLNDNQISNISPLLEQPSLDRLTLADNPLGDATSLATLVSLNQLDLSGTQISELPNWQAVCQWGCRVIIAERTSLSQRTLDVEIPELCDQWRVNVFTTEQRCAVCDTSLPH
ncbi:MAG TPA: leucine-rich repeat domain-containing protein [Polyangiaceae bacterium]|nr:leucine-rich repeat domain-containing protein [Polyangiaceae bacterium]